MRRIDLYSTENCGGCKRLKPILEDFSKENEVSINFVNLEKNRVAFEQYNVKSTPTMIFFNDGTEYNRFSGFAPIVKIQELFNAL